MFSNGLDLHPERCRPKPTHYLLDGQQRCNSIALGFLDPWKTSNKSVPAVLWIDLEPYERKDERNHIFRVLTKSHPWGYRRSDPSTTLETKQRRNALDAYKEAYENNNSSKSGKDLFRYGKFSLTDVWPWDAGAPIPFPFILEVVLNGGSWGKLPSLLEERLPFWSNESGINCLHDRDWREKVKLLLKNPTAHMGQLLEQIKVLVGTNHSEGFYQIPALELKSLVNDSNVESQTANIYSENVQDPVETLFVRVNSAGTPLQGEELIYSILKSIWPDAQEIVESISAQTMASSRLVLLLSRLTVARNSLNKEKPPAPPDVGRFRRLIQGKDSECKDFLSQIQKYLKNGKAKKLFYTAKTLLTRGTKDGTNYRLPMVLYAKLARNSPEVFFIFLVWLDQLLQNEINPLKFEEVEVKKIIGAVTALSWFSNNPSACVSTLWTRLQECERDLTVFFSDGSLKQCLKLDESGKIKLLPLIPWKILDKGVDKLFRGLMRCGYTKTWENWKWEESFAGIIPDNVTKWYQNHFRLGRQKEEPSDIRLDAWWSFVDMLWGKRELLYYAQRAWLEKWFPSYDPTSLDHPEDTNRPWDFDHIHPTKYQYNIKRKIPQVIRDWHGCIGNLRIWPFEANRSDGETPPRDKLSNVTDIEKIYAMDRSEELREASFISADWNHWEDSTPNVERFKRNYLTRPDDPKYSQCRVDLLKAIKMRWIALYKEWYNTLMVRKLF